MSNLDDFIHRLLTQTFTESEQTALSIFTDLDASSWHVGETPKDLNLASVTPPRTNRTLFQDDKPAATFWGCMMDSQTNADLVLWAITHASRLFTNALTTEEIETGLALSSKTLRQWHTGRTPIYLSPTHNHDKQRLHTIFSPEHTEKIATVWIENLTSTIVWAENGMPALLSAIKEHAGRQKAFNETLGTLIRCDPNVPLAADNFPMAVPTIRHMITMDMLSQPHTTERLASYRQMITSHLTTPFIQGQKDENQISLASCLLDIIGFRNHQQNPADVKAATALVSHALECADNSMGNPEEMPYHNIHHILGGTLPSMIIMLAGSHAQNITATQPEDMIKIPEADDALALLLGNILHDSIYSYGQPTGINEQDSLTHGLTYLASKSEQHELALLGKLSGRISQVILATIPQYRTTLIPRPYSIGAFMADCDVMESLAQPIPAAEACTDQVRAEMHIHTPNTPEPTLRGFYQYVVPMGFVSSAGRQLFQHLFEENQASLKKQA